MCISWDCCRQFKYIFLSSLENQFLADLNAYINTINDEVSLRPRLLYTLTIFKSVAEDTEIKSQLNYNKINKRIVLFVTLIEL